MTAVDDPGCDGIIPYFLSERKREKKKKWNKKISEYVSKVCHCKQFSGDITKHRGKFNLLLWFEMKWTNEAALGMLLNLNFKLFADVHKLLIRCNSQNLKHFHWEKKTTV